MLEIKNLSFSYTADKVLDEVNLELKEGECVCLLGKNGSGKTTLFKCIMGFLTKYIGEIFIDEELTKNLSVLELAKKIAYIPQAHDPTFNYFVKDIVLMGTNALAKRYSTPGEKEKKIVDEVLEILNITHLSDKGYAKISGGERQLVLIARALAQRSKILIMDEPTANLDYGNQLDVMQRVKSLTKSGYSVLMSTHNPEHILFFADKVLILDEGKSSCFGTPKEILTRELMYKIYGVDVRIEDFGINNGQISLIIPELG